MYNRFIIIIYFLYFNLKFIEWKNLIIYIKDTSIFSIIFIDYYYYFLKMYIFVCELNAIYYLK